MSPPVPDRPSAPREPVPVTGAWLAGDPVGDRSFATVSSGRPFHLEGGGELPLVELAYETWGALSPSRDNAILVCHALTGDAHVAGHTGRRVTSPGWWDGVVGPGLAIDTKRFHVVCANVLGGCQGSTGPSSLDPRTGRRYGSSFPTVSIRDMVRTQALLADQLGIERWFSVVGGSMGGMQVLEWGVMYPERCRSLVPIATTVAASAQQIAYSSVQRQTIALDPNWRGGDYYDAPSGSGPHRGLSIARALAQTTYRSDAVFDERFGRQVTDPLEPFDPWQRFAVEGYLDYHGLKLARRFDANSYLTLSKAMDLHDIGRERRGVEAALRRIRCPVRTMSIDSDALYPTYQQHLIRDLLASTGSAADDFAIHSPQGHDAFLLEIEQVAAGLNEFFTTLEGEP